MERELSNFLTYLSEQRRDVDSCMIAILSHGWKGNVIFGTDGCLDHQNCPKNGTFITTDYLRQLFSSSSCCAMEGKPKLFIIQACRGGKSVFRKKFIKCMRLCVYVTCLLTCGGCSLVSGIQNDTVEGWLKYIDFSLHFGSYCLLSFCHKFRLKLVSQYKPVKNKV